MRTSRLTVLCLLLLPALVWAQEPGLPTVGVVRQALQHPLMRDLTYWWLPLQGFTGSTVLFDQGPNRGDMTLSGAGGTQVGPQWANADRDGSVAQLRFDGTDDLAATAITENPTPFAPYTLCAWAKAATTMTSEQHVLDAGNPSGAPYGQLSLAWTFGNTNLPAFFWYYDGIGFMGVNSAIDVGVGAWVHLCGTNDGSGTVAGMALYINGVNQTAANGASIASWTGGAVLANPWRLGTTNFNGTIGEGMVFARALPAMEIQQLYQASQTGYQSLATDLLAQPYEQPVVLAGGAPLPWFRYPLLGAQRRLAPGLEQNLVSWWQATPGLSEASLWPDLMETGADGTLTGMGYSALTGWSATDRTGGQAQMAFDGTNDYVTTTRNAGVTPSTPYTLCVWALPTVGTGVRALIQTAPDGTISGEEPANPYNGVWFYLDTLQVRTGLFRDAGNQILIAMVGAISLNTWTHICAAHDGTATVAGLGIWLNGLPAATSIIGNLGIIPTLDVDRPWRIGADTMPTPTDLFQGAMDDVRVYSSRLSDIDIATMAQQGALSLAGIQPVTEVLPGGLAPTTPQGTFLPFFNR